MFLYKREIVRCSEFSTEYGFRKYPVSMDKDFNRLHHSKSVAEYLETLESRYRNQAITSANDNIGGIYEVDENEMPVIEQDEWGNHQAHSSAVLTSFSDAFDRLNSPDYLRAELNHYKTDDQYERFLNSRLFFNLCEQFDTFKSSGVLVGKVFCTPANIEWMTIVNDRRFKIDMFTGNYEQEGGKKQFDAYTLVGYSPEYRRLSASEMSLLAVALAEKYPEDWRIVYNIYIMNRPTKKILGGRQENFYLRVYLKPSYITHKPKTVEQTVDLDIY